MKGPKKLLLGVVLLLVIVVGAAFIWKKRASAPSPTTSKTNTSEAINTTTEPGGFNKNLYAIDQPSSPWWIVNKKRALPDGYVPSDLVVPAVKLRLGQDAPQMKFSKQAEPALISMFEAAKASGVTLVFGSGYRSYELQKEFYDGYVARDGQAAADRYSARPGTSEHQTGLAFDATSANGKCHLEICFEDTPEGKWIKAHAYEYGFVVRYLAGKETSTGYQYEPWHLRYVGKELAAQINQTSQTLEEFFGLPAVGF